MTGSTTSAGRNLDADVTRAAPAGLRLTALFSGRRQWLHGLGVAAWCGAFLYFWQWWIDPAHVVAWPSYLLITIVIGWITLLPVYFIAIFSGAKVATAQTGPVPQGRIAMVVTKAPSEPFAVVRKTLLAMLDQTGCDFDVWLADEDPSEDTMAWCAAHGVRVSTRKGVADYHRSAWPRRTRCKEGNLAYFYDHYGYERYDFVAQFDADHVPETTYLVEILRPFNDPSVGYVSAPSICDANAATSWAARGRLYAEASMHGALQAGYNNGWAPLCIGSHYAVRTKALKQIGGLGPELAEDHSTTLIMNAHGWRGVHALNAIAHGDGPANFADLAVQEFQWARSLVTILLKYSPVYVPRLSPRLRFQFLFSQLWYPLFSSFMALMFVMPIAALFMGRAFVAVTYPEFLLHFAPLSLVLIVLAYFWRSTGTFRPHDARVLSWESMLFLFARWPWSLLGCLAAVRDHFRGSFVDFRITPKGGAAAGSLPLRVLMPYLVLSVASALAAWFVSDAGTARGFYIFAGINTLIYAGLVVVIHVCHARENGLALMPRSTMTAATAGCLVLVSVLSAQSAVRHGAEATEALSHGLGFIAFTETRYTVAGAGRGTNLKIVRFRLKWRGFAQPSDSGSRVEASASSFAQPRTGDVTTTRKVARVQVPS
ncbi:MAG TPA: glycosyltransferase family 2 protein [Ensifer sp.]|jgi:cellulose synthase (UDP-forming)|uniref:glycosyltransferase family 2 protein n=1 Tax=Ensifer sp. TaxID=1872086 RepID=UPI002E123553|nr:glycosyltransferase family 2 protein [Ensifer sp.]